VSIRNRARRFVGAAMAGAMVLALMPAGIANATAHSDVCEGAPQAQFNDSAAISATFRDYVNCMAAYGITVGDGAGNFNPAGTVNRQNMAVFISRFVVQAETGTTTVPDAAEAGYTDAAAATAEGRRAINYLSARGVVEGYPDNSYRPATAVTRQQMASFIARAMEAVGAVLPDGDDTFPDVDADNVHADNINALAEAGIVRGYPDGTFRPGVPVTRQQMSQFIVLGAAELDDQDLWEGEFVQAPAPIGPNVPQTANPELVRVDRSGDIVTFTFDSEIPGKALDFINTDGDAGSLVAGDQVSYYTGLRLYDVGGTAYYPFEAGIFGNQVRARFANAAVVAGATRAGVYEGAVQDATGRSNPASDFALQATVAPPAAIPAYFPQLTFVGNLRTTQVTPAEILVDYRITFRNEADATGAAAAITTWVTEGGDTEALADEFALVGAAGQIFRGDDIYTYSRSGVNITVSVVMDPAIQEVPESQLQRGFIEEDAFLAAGLPHLLISQAYGSVSAVNGTTTDPDLRVVERGPGANQLRFVFDEAVSVPTGLLNNPDLYTITNNTEQRATPSSIGRSLAAADGARVMIATFTDADIPAGFATVAAYLNTVTAASVDVDWLDLDRTVVAAGAARGTDQVGSQQLGWNTPAQVLVTPVQPVVPADPVPGRTDLPDLVSVTKAQNSITGNWRVTYTFDAGNDPVPGDTDVDLSLYDRAGVRFSAASRDISWGAGTTNTAGQRVFTFGPDTTGALSAVFSNEQIAAAVLGTVQDADAELDNTGPLGGVGPTAGNEPRITEGHAPIPN
jgi:hypothetical protein